MKTPAALALTLFLATGCSPKPPAAPAPTPAAAPAPPPPPAAGKAVMICRNSQTGAKAKCGTPNAVMVGVKYE